MTWDVTLPVAEAWAKASELDQAWTVAGDVEATWTVQPVERTVNIQYSTFGTLTYDGFNDITYDDMAGWEAGEEEENAWD